MDLYPGWMETLATGLLPVLLLANPGQREPEHGEAQWAAVSACLLEMRTPVQENGGSSSSNTQGNSDPEASLASSVTLPEGFPIGEERPHSWVERGGWRGVSMTNLCPSQVRPPLKVLKVDCSTRKRDTGERRSPE